MDDSPEGHRLDHIAGVVFEGSIALTAGAGAIAFTRPSGATQTIAFVITALFAVPGFAAGWLLLWTPTDDAGFARKLRLVRAAMVMLLVGVPLLGVLAAAILFFPQKAVQAVGGTSGAVAAVVVSILYGVAERQRRR